MRWAWVFARFSGDAWFDWEWGHLDLLPQEVGNVVDKCRLFCPVPGPLQSVRRAEIQGVTLALQAAAAHVGVDDLEVVRPVVRSIEG